MHVLRNRGANLMMRIYSKTISYKNQLWTRPLVFIFIFILKVLRITTPGLTMTQSNLWKALLLRKKRNLHWNRGTIFCKTLSILALPLVCLYTICYRNKTRTLNFPWVSFCFLFLSYPIWKEENLQWVSTGLLLNWKHNSKLIKTSTTQGACQVIRVDFRVHFFST